MRSSMTLALALASGLAAPAVGQVTRSFIVRDDQIVVDVGAITALNGIGVNNSGQWLAEIDTDNIDTNVDAALIRNGLTVAVRENVAMPAGFTGNVSSFDEISLNNNNVFSMNMFLRNATTSTDSGLFYNGTIFLQESTLSTAAALSANTPYIGFFGTKINDNNQIFVVASVDDPAIATTVDRVITRFNFNPVNSTYTETVIWKEGDGFTSGALTTGAANDVGTNPYNWDINNAGDFIFMVDGPTADAVVRIPNGGSPEVLAIVGGTSPYNGLNWTSLGTTVAHTSINNSGGYVFTGNVLDGATTRTVLVKNGAAFKVRGVSTLVLDGQTVTVDSFGTTAQPMINDQGGVLWLADTSFSDTARDIVLMLDDEILLREGDVVDGITVVTIQSFQESRSMSENGRYIAVEVSYSDGTVTKEGYVLIDRGAGGPVCYPNCDQSTEAPILNVGDFSCFLTAFANGEAYANCDQSTEPPVLNVGDFSCFLASFANGCP